MWVAVIVAMFLQQSQSLGNKDVIGLVKLGLSTEIVIAKVKQSSCGYDTSPTALAELKSAGVPDAVSIAMIEAPCNPEVRSARAVDQGVRELYEVKRIFVGGMGKSDDANRFRLLIIIAIERPNERAY